MPKIHSYHLIMILVVLLVIIVALLLIPYYAFSAAPPPDIDSVLEKTAKLHIPFIENKGQFNHYDEPSDEKSRLLKR